MIGLDFGNRKHPGLRGRRRIGGTCRARSEELAAAAGWARILARAAPSRRRRLQQRDATATTVTNTIARVCLSIARTLLHVN